jgi:hypothetical protein
VLGGILLSTLFKQVTLASLYGVMGRILPNILFTQVKPALLHGVFGRALLSTALISVMTNKRKELLGIFRSFWKIWQP